MPGDPTQPPPADARFRSPALPAAGPTRTLFLASRSPRRRTLLSEHAFPHEVLDSGIDDAQLSIAPNVAIRHWTCALAYLKARAGVSRLPDGRDRPGAVILGADTLVAKAGRVIGQPRDSADARRIIRTLAAGEHRVVTGVALIRSGPDRETRLMFADTAIVRVGPLTDDQIERYIASGAWAGKAGAYNLVERLAAGWPITFIGDPATVMGLPMRVLGPMLKRLLVHWPSEMEPAP